MTIKQIEALSGMTRANIRYYEQMGLLLPSREKNGYRDYSEVDLAMLKRIKLLRGLQVSIEEIKRMQMGEITLHALLMKKLERLEQQQQDTASAHRLCSKMCADRISFDTLDAERYLEGIADEPTAAAYIERDVTKDVFYPARRICARLLDLVVYALFWHIVCELILHRNLRSWLPDLLGTLESNLGMVFGTFGSVILLVFLNMMLLASVLLLEPILLCLFRTTLGKFVFALRLEDENGCRPRYRDAFKRTWRVFWRGMAGGIPLLWIYTLVRFIRICYREQTLSWDYDLDYRMTSNRNLRYGIFAVCLCVCIGFQTFVSELAVLPPNRGALTVAEFAENYNALSRYYGLNGRLNADGSPKTTVARVAYETDENGNLTAVLYTQSPITKTIYLGAESYHPVQIDMAAFAFVGAQEQAGLFSDARKQLEAWTRTYSGYGETDRIADIELTVTDYLHTDRATEQVLEMRKIK